MYDNEPKVPLFREFFRVYFNEEKLLFWTFFYKKSFFFKGEVCGRVECESEYPRSFGSCFEWRCLALTKTDNTSFKKL